MYKYLKQPFYGLIIFWIKSDEIMEQRNYLSALIAAFQESLMITVIMTFSDHQTLSEHQRM